MLKKENLKKKPNISHLFLIPSLSIKETIRKEFKSFGYINSYLKCTHYEYPFESLFLLFCPENFTEEFYKFNLKLESNPNFVETIDLLDNQVLVVYKIPLRFEQDAKLITEGRYSRTSLSFKRLFPMNEESIFYDIFNKTQKLAERYMKGLNLTPDELPEEFYSKMKISDETLNW